MKIILLSGGTGTRLWPITDANRPKQFIKLFKNDETNELESMFQRVYRQLKKITNEEDIIITSNKSQIDLIQNEVGKDTTIVIEPEVRDTFPAIALAVTYLFSNRNISENETLAIVSVDTFAEDAFFNGLQELEKIIKNNNAQLGLIGIKPTINSSNYGYIIPKYKNEFIKVKEFIEKPSKEEASLLISKGAFWNSGVFVLKSGLILKILKEMGLPNVYSEFLKEFVKLPKNSFDYEVVEKMEDIIAICYEGTWKDLGTWNSLTEEMDSNIIGNAVIVDNNCENVHIINELNLPVKVIGVSDIVVAISDKGILVSNKEQSYKLKEFL